MPLNTGARLGLYEILAPIGAGGMGKVYKAKDHKLDRYVVVKVLRPELADDPERLRRFEQEARAASALNHPNIVTVHDLGEHEGAPYIAVCANQATAFASRRSSSTSRTAINFGRSATIAN